MTPIKLVDTLIEYLKPVVETFELQSNIKGIKKAPQITGGFLNEKKPQQMQDVPDFPFVIVRYLEDEDNEDAAIASVRIIAGTYSEDAKDGWRDCLNVVTRIKQHLLAHPFIGGPFRVEKPMRTELPEEQPVPEWIASLTIQVVIPVIEEEGVIDDDDY